MRRAIQTKVRGEARHTERDEGWCAHTNQGKEWGRVIQTKERLILRTLLLICLFLVLCLLSACSVSFLSVSLFSVAFKADAEAKMMVTIAMAKAEAGGYITSSLHFSATSF